MKRLPPCGQLFSAPLSPLAAARLEDVDTALSHRSHRQLGLTGDPDLAHDDDVERSTELAGDGRRDRHASSWEPEHHDRRARAMAQLGREPMPGVVAVYTAADFGLPTVHGFVMNGTINVSP